MARRRTDGQHSHHVVLDNVVVSEAESFDLLHGPSSGWLVPGTCTRKRLRSRSAKRTPNTVGARILRKKTRCKNTLKMCRLCFVIKVSNAPGLGAMNSLGAQTARRVKRLAARSVGCIIRLFAEDAADANGRLHRCQVESERTVAQSHLRSMLLSPSWRWLEIAISGWLV
jgi:hypothetical protein